MSESRWMAFDVGCIECGESSGIVGFFGTREEAEAAAFAAAERQEDSWNGQHYFQVFDTASRSEYADV